MCVMLLCCKKPTSRAKLELSIVSLHREYTYYVGPGKVTPCLGSLIYPEIETPFRKDLQFLVSHPKYFQLPVSLLGVFVGIFMAVHFQVHRVQIKCSLF